MRALLYWWSGSGVMSLSLHMWVPFSGSKLCTVPGHYFGGKVDLECHPSLPFILLFYVAIFMAVTTLEHQELILQGLQKFNEDFRNIRLIFSILSHVQSIYIQLINDILSTRGHSYCSKYKAKNYGDSTRNLKSHRHARTLWDDTSLHYVPTIKTKESFLCSLLLPFLSSPPPTPTTHTQSSEGYSSIHKRETKGSGWNSVFHIFKAPALQEGIFFSWKCGRVGSMETYQEIGFHKATSLVL